MCPCNFRPTRAEAAEGKSVVRRLSDVAAERFLQSFIRFSWSVQTMWKQGHSMSSVSVPPPPTSTTSASSRNVWIPSQQSPPHCTWHFLSDIYFVRSCYLCFFSPNFLDNELERSECVWWQRLGSGGTVPCCYTWQQSLWWADWGVAWIGSKDIWIPSEEIIHVYRQ